MSTHLKQLRGQIDPVLTNLALGYKQAEFIGERIMPVVFTDKEGLRVPVFGKGSSHAVQLGSFASEQGARRAWGYYAKKNPELEIKVGVLDKKLLTKNDLNLLAELPGREVLLQVIEICPGIFHFGFCPPQLALRNNPVFRQFSLAVVVCPGQAILGPSL